MKCEWGKNKNVQRANLIRLGNRTQLILLAYYLKINTKNFLQTHKLERGMDSKGVTFLKTTRWH